MWQLRVPMIRSLLCIALGALPVSAEDDFDDKVQQPVPLTADQISLLNRSRFEDWLQVEVRYRVDDFRAKYDLTQSQQARLALACQADVRRVSAAVTQPQHVANIRQQNLKLFGSHSFLSKAIFRILTTQQAAKYVQDVDDRLRLQHRSNVEGVVREFERHVVLRIPQQEAIADLILSNVSPCKTEAESELVTLRNQIAELPELLLKPIFDEDQWPAIRQVLDGYRQLVPNNRAADQTP